MHKIYIINDQHSIYNKIYHRLAGHPEQNFINFKNLLYMYIYYAIIFSLKLI